MTSRQRELAQIPTGPCKVRAIYSWSGEGKADLGFIEGDFIDVINTGDGDWWTGRLRRNKMVGVFPRNFVEFTDPNQACVPHPDVAQFAIPNPYSNSQGSTNSRKSHSSHKSTDQLLQDISYEVNGPGYKSLDTKPSELDIRRSVANFDDSFSQSQEEDSIHSYSVYALAPPTQSVMAEDDTLSLEHDEPPAPPPHRFLHSKSESSRDGFPETGYNLMRPVTNSPDLEEVPFDPRAFAPKAPVAVDREKSVSSQAAVPSATVRQSSNTSKSPNIVRKLFEGVSSGSDVTRRTSTAQDGSKANVPFFRSWKPLTTAFKSDDRSRIKVENTKLNQASEMKAAQSDASKMLLDPKWMTSQRDLYRSKTITEHELTKRKQSTSLQGVQVDNPMEILEHNALDHYDFSLENFSHVDTPILAMSHWPQLMTPAVMARSRIGREFTDEADRIRAIFMLCAAHITYQPPLDTVIETVNSTTLNNVMQSRRADPQTLAYLIKDMCEALNIRCTVVKGHYRPPDGASTGIEHFWNLVSVDGEHRFLDASAASPTFPGSAEDEINASHFLSPPHQFIFTHVPNDQKNQCLSPSLPTSLAVALPVASPSAFRLGVTFADYFPGIAHMTDLEMCELSLVVSNSQLDIVAEVLGDDGNRGSALAQPYWENGKRQFRVKGFLPEHASRGALHLYAVARSQSSRLIQDMDLLYTLPLWHRGKNYPFMFLSRFAAAAAVRHDVYIREPQCKQLKGGQTYSFKFIQHPSKGITAGSGLTLVHLAVQSPSGRISKMVKRGTDIADTWKVTVRTMEVGPWRALISQDGGAGWVAFAEWFCE